MDQYYTTLGIPEFTSDQKVIRSAYMNQIKFFHPDLYNGPPEIAQIKTQQLNEAYRILRDTSRKADYDTSLRMEAEKLQQQRQSAYGASKSSNHTNAAKFSGSKNLFKVLSFISALLLLSLIAVIILFFYSTRNYNLPLSGKAMTQSALDGNSGMPQTHSGNVQTDESNLARKFKG